MLTSVAILFNPRRKQASVEAHWLKGELEGQGIRADVSSGWDADVVSQLCCNRDLIVTFGGDGTIIRVSRLAAPLEVPLFGINLGRVGFLAEMTPERLHHMVDKLVAGEFWIEERTMLDVRARVDGHVLTYVCLNEIAVARGAAPRAVHVKTILDGDDFMTYTADGVLVSTATGSTAYSLAAGGPILYPESRDFMITPVAPHLHIGRSMIVPGHTVVRLMLSSERMAVLSIDGTEEHALGPHDTIEVSRSDLIARFVRFGPRSYFHVAIAARLR